VLQIVNMIPKSLSGETDQDSEPNLAVNPEQPNQIVATAFTQDPMNGNRAGLRRPGRGCDLVAAARSFPAPRVLSTELS
jgi:hypothetical protein